MLEGKNNWKAWIYLLPALILLAGFTFYPIINSFIISFIKDYDPINKPEGGFQLTISNYLTVFRNVRFTNAIKNTLVVALISVPLSVIIALLISVALTSIKPLQGFFQTIYFLPYVTSAMAVAMAFSVMFSNVISPTAGSVDGPINSFLKAVKLDKPVASVLDKLYWWTDGQDEWADFSKGIDEAYSYDESGMTKDEFYDSRNIATKTVVIDGINRTVFSHYKIDEYQHKYRTLGYIDWMGNYATWWTSIIVLLVYSVWGSLAFKILVFVGGLQGIDKQYYDAAKIDSTPKWRVLTKITIPMLSPLIVYITITSFIGAFKIYSSIIGLYGTSKMGPSSDPDMLYTFVGIVYSYLGEGNDNLHLAAAAAVVLFGIILVFTGIQSLITRKRVHY